MCLSLCFFFCKFLGGGVGSIGGGKRVLNVEKKWFCLVLLWVRNMEFWYVWCGGR